MSTTFATLSRREAVGTILGAAAAVTTGSSYVLARASTETTSSNRLGLGTATRDYRTRLMRELMDREQLDALGFTSDRLIRFATNFSTDVAFFERPCLCVLPRHGEPFIILHELSTNHWRFDTDRKTAWVEDASFYSEHPRVTERLPLASQWNEMVVAKLEAAGLHRARIGSDEDGLARVAELLPHLRLDNVGAKCSELFLVKHDEEIALLRVAASLSDWAQERYRENIRPGRLVAELDMRIVALIMEEAARRFPGADLSVSCRTLSGPASCCPNGIGGAHGTRIEAGHVMINSINAALDATNVTNERTWFCRKPSQRQVRLFEAARSANEAACGAAMSGKPTSAIDAAAFSVLQHTGVSDLILGHGMALRGKDLAANTMPLRDRQVFSIDPGVYEWGVGGFRHADSVVVGKRPEVLTKAPKSRSAQTVS